MGALQPCARHRDPDVRRDDRPGHDQAAEDLEPEGHEAARGGEGDRVQGGLLQRDDARGRLQGRAVAGGEAARARAADRVRARVL